MNSSTVSPRVVTYTTAEGQSSGETACVAALNRQPRSSHALCVEAVHSGSGMLNGPTAWSPRVHAEAPGPGTGTSVIRIAVALDAATASHLRDKTKSDEIPLLGGIGETRARHDAPTTAGRDYRRRATGQTVQGSVAA